MRRLEEDEMNIGMTRTLTGHAFDAALDAVRVALARQGFKVLTELDPHVFVDGGLPRYRILSAGRRQPDRPRSAQGARRREPRGAIDRARYAREVRCAAR
jgi:hypothetical protein